MNWGELDELWQLRHQPKQVEELRQHLKVVAGTLGSDAAPRYESGWRLARAAHFAAMQAREAKNEALAGTFYDEGRDQAREICGLQPLRVEGHFWLGVNLLEGARLRGSLASLAVLGRAEHHLERAAHIDESFHFAGPLRVLGRVAHFKPLILGGQIDNALAFYRQALQLAPHNSTTLLYYGEALLADQQFKELRRILAQIINAPRDEDWVWEQERDRKAAQGILDELNR